MVIFEVTFAKPHHLCVLCKQNELPMRANFKCPAPYWYSLVFAKNTSASRCFAAVRTKYSAHGGILGKSRWVLECKQPALVSADNFFDF